MANHDKETVLKAAEGMWPNILSQLAGIDSKYLNHNKHCDCPLGCIGGSSSNPGGKDRYRWMNKPDGHSICNVCGSRDGLNLYLDFTGHSFIDAINDIGNFLNMIPVERREMARREVFISNSFPTWYKFDMDKYKQIKDVASVGISPWQRVSGLNVLDILKHGDEALIPLINEHGKAVDFTMIDIDGNWQTTGGNKSVPSGFYSTFGDTKGKHTYIAVNPFHSAHASIFMQRQVICCYDVANIWDVAKNLEDAPVIVTASMDDVLEADSLNFKQLTFNSKNNCVNRRLYEAGEIVKLKKGGA